MPSDGGFYVLPSYYAALSLLPVKDRGEVWAAMMDYAFAGVAPELPARLLPYWLLIQPSIDAAAKRKQRRDNGRTMVEQWSNNVQPMVDQCTHNVTPMDEQCRDIGRPSCAREIQDQEREREREQDEGTGTRTGEPTAYPLPTFSNEHSARFEKVWAAYPKKTGRYQAQHVWTLMVVDDALTDKIITSIRAHQALPSWQEDNGRYIPALSKFLHDGLYEDQLDTPVNTSTTRTLSPQERAAIRELMEG